MAGAGGWQREFDDAIDLPDGKRLTTLRDAADFLRRTSRCRNGKPRSKF